MPSLTLKNWKELPAPIWRQLIVVVVLLSLFLLGKPLQGGLQPQIIKDPGTPFSYDFSLDYASASKVLWDRLDPAVGDYYRLSYTAYGLGNTTTTAGADVITTQLLGDGGELNSIGLDTIQPGQMKNFEHIFQITSSPDRNLQFSTQLATTDDEIRIKAVRISRLSVQSLKEADSLIPTQFGVDTARTVSGQVLSTTAQPLYTFSNSNQEFGQIFKATSTSMAGVEFNLKVIGGGGSGYYSLYLKKANLEKDGYHIDSNSIATFYVNPDLLFTHFADPSREGYYYMPLPASLQKGAYYYVSLVATASLNRSNTLQFLGSSQIDNLKDGVAGTFVSNNPLSTQGVLNYQIYTTKQSAQTSPGLFVEDRGLGLSTFSYSSNSSLSWGDIQKESTTEEIYKLRSQRPFSSANLSLDNDQSGVTVSYSTDGSHWIQVPEISSYYSITQTNFSSTLYLKFTKNNVTTSWPGFGVVGEMEDHAR